MGSSPSAAPAPRPGTSTKIVWRPEIRGISENTFCRRSVLATEGCEFVGVFLGASEPSGEAIPPMLTDKAIRAARPGAKPYKLSDGGGLYLFVKPNGSRLWRLKYRVDGIEKTLSFGAYPQVTLSLARERRDESKRLTARGVDPGREAQGGEGSTQRYLRDNRQGVAGDASKAG